MRPTWWVNIGFKMILVIGSYQSWWRAGYWRGYKVRFLLLSSIYSTYIMNSSFRSFIFNILISCLFSNEVCINLLDEDEMPSISSKVDEEDFVICSVPHQEISPHIAVSMKDWKTLEKGTWIRDGMIFVTYIFTVTKFNHCLCTKIYHIMDWFSFFIRYYQWV